jgi:hypothetical protein
LAEIEHLEADAEKCLVLRRTEDLRVVLITMMGARWLSLGRCISGGIFRGGMGPSGLTEAARRTELLLPRVYASGKQEENWVCCEKSVGMGALDDEVATVLRTGMRADEHRQHPGPGMHWAGPPRPRAHPPVMPR